MSIHFISDLHLSPATPTLTHLFSKTLDGWQGKLEALYILGDLFDAWIGDDDDTPYAVEQTERLRQFSKSTPLFIMRGNRDFLLGEVFAKASGAILLDDPHILVYGNQRYVLTHGDCLCTDDVPYQQFRLMTRNPAWQAATLTKPLAERRLLAQQLRMMSEDNKQQQGKSAISDATEQGVQALLTEHSVDGVPPVLIHGHTHRPAMHHHQINSQSAERWVIADWHDDHGGYLSLDENGLTAHSL